MAEEKNDRLDIDWVRTTAGALAAVSTAVLLSTLGAAGTLIGAALGSVAATVTTALYSQGLARSRQKVAAVHQQALQKVGVAQDDVRRAVQDPARRDLEEADERLVEAEAELDEAEQRDPRSWKERLRALPWRRIGLYAAGLFATAVLVLSAVEALLGNPVSSYTGGSDKGGGTSISRITGGDKGTSDRGSDRDGSDRDGSNRDGSDKDTSDGDGDRQQDGGTPSDSGTTSPSEGTSEGSTPTPTPTPTPNDELAEQPSETPPTGTPTPTPNLSEQQLSDQRAPSGVPSQGISE